MDAKTKDAFNNVRKFAKYFESLGQVIETFDLIEQAENAVAENERRVKALKAEAERIEKANLDASGIAQQTIEQATARAEEIKASALDTANRQVSEAKATASKWTADAESKLWKADEALRVAQEQEQATALLVSEKQAELEALEAKIAKAQAQITKILGG